MRERAGRHSQTLAHGRGVEANAPKMAAGELRLPRRAGAVRPAAGSGGVVVPESSPAGGPAAGLWGASGRVSAFALSAVAISAREGIGSRSRCWVAQGRWGFSLRSAVFAALKCEGAQTVPSGVHFARAIRGFVCHTRKRGRGLACGGEAPGFLERLLSHRASPVTNSQEGLCRGGKGGGVTTGSSVLVSVLRRGGSWGRSCLGGRNLRAGVPGFLPAPLWRALVSGKACASEGRLKAVLARGN